MDTVKSLQLGGTDLKYHPNENKLNLNSRVSNNLGTIHSNGVKDIQNYV